MPVSSCRIQTAGLEENVHSENAGSDRQGGTQPRFRQRDRRFRPRDQRFRQIRVTIDRNPPVTTPSEHAFRLANDLGVIQRSSASRMSCSNNAPRPRSVIARPPRPFGVTKPNVRSLPAISIGIGGGSRFASVAACSLRSQSKSSGVRFGFVALILFQLTRVRQTC